MDVTGPNPIEGAVPTPAINPAGAPPTADVPAAEGPQDRIEISAEGQQAAATAGVEPTSGPVAAEPLSPAERAAVDKGIEEWNQVNQGLSADETRESAGRRVEHDAQRVPTDEAFDAQVDDILGRQAEQPGVEPAE